MVHRYFEGVEDMSSKAQNYSIDMVHGPLLKNIFIFSVPLMFANFLQILFNAADTVVVGKFAGEAALAAVGATGSIVFLITAMFNGLSMGTNVIVARLIGLKDPERIEKAVHTSLCMGLVGGVFLTLFGLLFSGNLLSMISTPSDIIDLSKLYMRIYFGGSIFLLVYNFGASILRAKGDTKRPLYFLMISGVLNVVLNLFFVVVLKMSVAGVAIATVISQGVSAVLVCDALIKDTDETRLQINKLKIDMPTMIEVIRIGLPAGIQGMVFSLSNVVIQSSINSFDSSTIVAANSAASNIENFVYIGTMAFTQATVTFTSQNLGAGKIDSIAKIMWITLGLTAASAAFMGIFVCVFGNVFLGFYTNEAAVIQTGMIRLKYVALWLVLNGTFDVFVASMRGMGYSTLPTVLMLFGICGIRLMWIWTVFPQVGTLESIYVCFPISWSITLVIQGILWIWVHRHMLKTHTVKKEAMA